MKQIKNKKQIQDMFSGVADRYDLINHLLSFGIDFYWRKAAVKSAKPKPDERLIDICCGTGDFAFSFAHAGVKTIAACDFSNQMLRLAKQKQKKSLQKGKLTGINFDWILGDYCDADFEEQAFDIVSCAFGVRNLTDLQLGLARIYKLLKTGGRACILEFTLPKGFFAGGFYRFYLRCLLPAVAGIISGRSESYKYFAESICRWDDDVNLESKLKSVGFSTVTVTPLTFGVAACYIAYKQ